MRIDGRKNTQLREIKFHRNVNKYAEGSCLVEMGQTRVLCTASVEDKVPYFLRDKNEGWLTAEYRMLPRSTENRITREKLSGRIYEVQRLIGRSLRSVFDTKKVPDKTFIIDCDVLQADGGTRTASINGGFVALMDACIRLQKEGRINALPIKECVAAVSVGVFDKHVLVDLAYQEDSHADVDMNVVMTSGGLFVEVQGTGEKSLFDRALLDSMLVHAEKSIQTILSLQQILYKKFLSE